MSRRRALTGWAAFGGALLGGAALGVLGERRTIGQQTAGLAADPLHAELNGPVPGEATSITSFDGTRLRAQVTGPAGGDVVVLVHGYGMAARFWHFQLRDLAEEFRVVAYDQRGHGDSDPAAGGDYSIAALGHDLDAVLAATVEPGERAVVVGHSMGAMAVMALAREHPETVVERLAGAALGNTGSSGIMAAGLWSTALGAVGAFEARSGLRARGWHLPQPTRPSDLTFLVSRAVALSPEAPAALVRFVERLFMELEPDARMALARTLASLDLDDTLGALTVPVLVIASERDRLTPVAHARRLCEWLPRSRLLMLPDVGHSTPLEAHEAVTAAIAEHARAAFAQAAADDRGR